jgi:hypothetical protein
MYYTDFAMQIRWKEWLWMKDSLAKGLQTITRNFPRINKALGNYLTIMDN